MHRRRRARGSVQVEAGRSGHAAGGHPIYGTQDYDFTIRGIYKAGSSAVDNQSMMFHWKYLDERALEHGIGWFVAKVADPDKATLVAQAIDQKFANSPAETKTDTERAFSAQFRS